MREEGYFYGRGKRELFDIMTRLTDFIHEHSLKQVVGAGPSATPYARALVQAYRARYGGKIRVVSLGEVAEKLVAKTDLGYEPRSLPLSEAEALLRQRRAKLSLAAKSLLFDEILGSGETLKRLSAVFGGLKTPHKTAVLVDDSRGVKTVHKPDFVGLTQQPAKPGVLYYKLGVDIGRGKILSKARKKRATPAETRENRESLRTVGRELGEVVSWMQRKRERNRS